MNGIMFKIIRNNILSTGKFKFWNSLHKYASCNVKTSTTLFIFKYIQFGIRFKCNVIIISVFFCYEVMW